MGDGRAIVRDLKSWGNRKSTAEVLEIISD
jgi:hypothetical protein